MFAMGMQDCFVQFLSKSLVLVTNCMTIFILFGRES